MSDEAINHMHRAREMIELVRLACREGGEELGPMDAGLFAALAALDAAEAVLGVGPVSGLAA